MKLIEGGLPKGIPRQVHLNLSEIDQATAAILRRLSACHRQLPCAYGALLVFSVARGMRRITLNSDL